MKYNVPLEMRNNEAVSELLQYVSPNSVVLEFGCANGRMTRYMKEQLGCSVYIVEYEEAAFRDAIKYAQDGLCGDIMEFQWLERFANIRFDYVIFADVLEHLSNPNLVLERVNGVLKEDGSVLVSVPNVGHNDILIKLFGGKFEYTDVGLLDNTHIHFFAEQTIDEFCKKAGFLIIKKRYIKCNTGESEQFAGMVPNIHPIVRSAIDERVNGKVYQFLLVLQKESYVEKNNIASDIEKDVYSSIFGRVYYDYGSGFSELNCQNVEIPQVEQGVYEFGFTIELKEELKAIRFDPVEGKNCLIIAAGAEVGIHSEKVEFVNGLLGESEALLIGPDPQMLVDCRAYSCGKLYLHVRFSPEGSIAYAKAMNILKCTNEQKEQLTSQVSEYMKQNNSLQEEINNQEELNKNLQEEINNQEKRNKYLQEEINNQEERNKHLQEEIINQEERNKHLQEEINNQEERNKHLQEEINNQEERNEDLQEQKNKQEAQNKYLQEQISSYSVQNEQLEKKLTEFSKQNEGLERQVREYVDYVRNEKNSNLINCEEIKKLHSDLNNMTDLYHDACRQSTENYNRLVERAQAAEYWEDLSLRMKKTKSWRWTKPFRASGYIKRYLQKQREFKANMENCTIKFSIVMPVYNVKIQWLEKAIQSIKAQTYANWELCIADDASTESEVVAFLRTQRDKRIKIKYLSKNGGISVASNEAAKLATGDYILLMDNDDEIAPDALQEFFECASRTNADVIYSDQDIIDLAGNHSCPVCKPDWSPDLFCSQMYLGHLIGFKRELFNKVGGFRKEFDGSQDYDLLLRITEITSRIEHISKILYSWRTVPTSTAADPNSKPYAQYAGLRAIQDHLDRTLGEGKAEAVETDNLFVYDVKYPLDSNIKISIIIPTKDHAEDLKMAIDSIFEMSSHRNFEIIILNNNSEEKETYEYFETLKREHNNVRVEEAFYEFNWSKLNNQGISVATGDVYLFLNNDVRVLTEDWLERLASQALRPEVGAVGALLLYDDGTIQHAGVVVGFGGWADHAYKGMLPVHNGTPFISPVVTRNVSAVTGACMAISRQTIEKIGNFDDDFIICGSDVEICIRANQKGLVNIYDPYVRLFHYESKSRGTFVPQIDFDLSYKMYTPYRENGDPYYNNNLDYSSFIPRLKGTAEPDIPQEEYMQVSIPEITPIHFRKVEIQNKRLNILLPSLNPEHVFGGIATAYKFFCALQAATNMDCRIILTDAAPNQGAVDKYGDEYMFVTCEDDIEASKLIVPLSDRAGRTLPVSENDYFIFTGWWTAYCIQEEYKNWKDNGLQPNPFVYLIQDYEPGFYQWSSLYLLADSTYRTEFEQIAVFNASELKTYFDFLGYKFTKSYVFEPILNAGLKEHILKMDKVVKKKKQILVYGRPNTARNAFALLVQALRSWVEMQEDIADWRILSAGEEHKKVDLGRGMVLEPVGKLTIEEYARTLEESYAGISLMVSPHPSYPPLEMSVFGVKVITNSYANKDISNFNDNIISLRDPSPTNIAEKMCKICREYLPQKEINLDKNKEYCFGSNSFPFIYEINSYLFSGKE